MPMLDSLKDPATGQIKKPILFSLVGAAGLVGYLVIKGKSASSSVSSTGITSSLTPDLSGLQDALKTLGSTSSPPASGGGSQTPPTSSTSPVAGTGSQGGNAGSAVGTQPSSTSSGSVSHPTYSQPSSTVHPVSYAGLTAPGSPITSYAAQRQTSTPLSATTGKRGNNLLYEGGPTVTQPRASVSTPLSATKGVRGNNLIYEGGPSTPTSINKHPAAKTVDTKPTLASTKGVRGKSYRYEGGPTTRPSKPATSSKQTSKPPLLAQNQRARL